MGRGIERISYERHTPDGIEEIDVPGMMELRDRFMSEIEDNP